MIASLIDCHGTGSAAAAAYRAQGREMGSDPPLRFLTAKLEVDYLGFVLDDKAVGRAVREQRPFMRAYPNSLAAACVTNLAAALFDVPVAEGTLIATAGVGPYMPWSLTADVFLDATADRVRA